jgi:hypothetical protein
MRQTCISGGYLAHDLGTIFHREYERLAEQTLTHLLDIHASRCADRLRSQLGQFIHIERNVSHCHFMLLIAHPSSGCEFEELGTGIPISRE